MEQKDFLELANAGNNIDLSGYAGTGKTTVLKQFIEEQRSLKKNVVIVGPTGIAAINVGGATLHSTFKIFGNEYGMINKQKVDWRGVDIIIFDEKSMIGPDLFDHCNNIVKMKTGIRDKSFGGKQVILCGDMAQLPPIYKTVTKLEIEKVNELRKKYGRLIYSSSDAYKEGNFKEIFLTHIYRQSDNRLLDILNDLRDGDITAINGIQKGNYNEKQEKESVHIMPYNNMVDEYNDKQFSLLKEKKHIYRGNVSGKINIDNILTPEILDLKRRCRVMLTKNMFDLGLYNGDLGIVVKCEDDYVTVDFDRVGTKDIPYVTRENREYEGTESTIVGTFTQIPLRLSYALTTHKSQGLSLDKVIVHYVPGMSKENLYVAVSRSTNYDTLFLSK